MHSGCAGLELSGVISNLSGYEADAGDARKKVVVWPESRSRPLQGGRKPLFETLRKKCGCLDEQ